MSETTDHGPDPHLRRTPTLQGRLTISSSSATHRWVALLLPLVISIATAIAGIKAADAAKQAAQIATLHYQAYTPRVAYKLQGKQLIVYQHTGRPFHPSFAWVSCQYRTPENDDIVIDERSLPLTPDTLHSLAPVYVSSDLTSYIGTTPCADSDYIRIIIYGVSESEKGPRHGERQIYVWP